MVFFFLFFTGIFLLFAPKLWWLITEKWTTKDAEEPSDLFILNTRIGGTICTLLGLIGIVMKIFGVDI